MNNANKIGKLVNKIERMKEKIDTLGIPKKIIEKEIRSFGNGGHVVLPKEFVNKKARIIIS